MSSETVETREEVLVLRHIAIEGPGLFGPLLEAAGLPHRIVDLEAGERVPDSPAGIRAVVCLGGPMGVDEVDRYPFLRDEVRFIRQCLEGAVPFLGICLGAQLLARAAGASVGPAPRREIGWYEVDLTPAGRADPLFAGLPDPLPVFHWHGDTFDLPPGGVLLATSGPVANQAIRVGQVAYGLQFHLEVTASMVGEWAEAYAGELAAVAWQLAPAAPLEEPGDYPGRVAEAGRALFAAFLRLAAA